MPMRNSLCVPAPRRVRAGEGVILKYALVLALDLAHVLVPDLALVLELALASTSTLCRRSPPKSFVRCEKACLAFAPAALTRLAQHRHQG